MVLITRQKKSTFVVHLFSLHGQQFWSVVTADVSAPGGSPLLPAKSRLRTGFAGMQFDNK